MTLWRSPEDQQALTIVRVSESLLLTECVLSLLFNLTCENVLCR